jgi:hypothetical protein
MLRNDLARTYAPLGELSEGLRGNQPPFGFNSPLYRTDKKLRCCVILDVARTTAFDSTGAQPLIP